MATTIRINAAGLVREIEVDGQAVQIATIGASLEAWPGSPPVLSIMLADDVALEADMPLTAAAASTSVADFLDSIDPGTLEAESLALLGMGDDRTYGELFLELLRSKAQQP